MLTFHIHSYTDQYLDDLEKYPVFTSLRHPMRMIASYRKRENAGGEPLWRKIQQFHAGWKFMLEKMPKYNPMFVHVDSDKRDEQVDAMAEILDLPLAHNWAVNELSGSVHGTHAYGTNGNDPEVRQEYIDFYNETLLT